MQFLHFCTILLGSCPKIRLSHFSNEITFLLNTLHLKAKIPFPISDFGRRSNSVIKNNLDLI